MPVNEELLKILCCPATKSPIVVLPDDKIASVNARIAGGSVTYNDGSEVDSELQEGLITETGDMVYRVDDGIPIMLADKGISTAQLGDF